MSKPLKEFLIVAGISAVLLSGAVAYASLWKQYRVALDTHVQLVNAIHTAPFLTDNQQDEILLEGDRLPVASYENKGLSVTFSGSDARYIDESAENSDLSYRATPAPRPSFDPNHDPW